MPDPLRFEPLTERTVGVDKTVVGAAGNPKQAQLRGGFRVERGESCIEVIAQLARAESANPGEAVYGVQAGMEGFGASHG
jgi:hypothetical protein